MRQYMLGPVISAASILIACATFFVTDEWILIGLLVALLLALFGIAGALAARKVMGPSRARARLTGVCVGFTVVIFSLQLMFGLLVLSRVREYSMAALTASNLRGIGEGIERYFGKNGVYPESLDQLVASNLCGPDQFFAWGDPDWKINPHPETRPVYSSFEYRRPVGTSALPPGTIVAHCRLAWSPDRLRLIPRYVRLVLTADGSIRRLDDRDFEQVIRTNRAAATQRMMETAIPEICIFDPALASVLEWVSNISKVPIVVDWDELMAAGVNRDAAVTGSFRSDSLRECLQRLIEEADGGRGVIAMYADENGVLISTERSLAQRVEAGGGTSR